MEVNYLIDTNIFLEILLDQNKKETCKKYLNERIGYLYISDFSLHSIGVILFKYRKDQVFQNFIKDTFNKTELITLPTHDYNFVLEVSKKYNLDFDDSYQTSVADRYGLRISTMDNDFKKISEDYLVDFIE